MCNMDEVTCFLRQAHAMRSINKSKSVILSVAFLFRPLSFVSAVFKFRPPNVRLRLVGWGYYCKLLEELGAGWAPIGVLIKLTAELQATNVLLHLSLALLNIV